MNKKILNFIFYLSISFFAFHCAGSNAAETAPETTPETALEKTKEQRASGSQQYVDEVLLNADKEKKYNPPKIDLDIENVLITDLQAELHNNKKELQKLRSLVKNLESQLENQTEKNMAELWATPLSIYNQELLMQSGTVYYGNIVYQDEAMVTLESMIGKLNLDRNKIVRVISHRTDALSGIEQETVFAGLDDFSDIEDGSIIYKKPAEITLLGNISSSSDQEGNTRLIGKVKNTGGRRADFVKLNITLYRDWSKSLTPKTFAIFVDGETQYLNPQDSTYVSFSSLSPKAEADFELFIPQNFGTVMSWTYEIDYEEYDYK